MTFAFQNRQKEMKRLEKRRVKQERRALKKFEKQAKEETAKGRSTVLPNRETGN